MGINGRNWLLNRSDKKLSEGELPCYHLRAIYWYQGKGTAIISSWWEGARDLVMGTIVNLQEKACVPQILWIDADATISLEGILPIA